MDPFLDPTTTTTTTSSSSSSSSGGGVSFVKAAAEDFITNDSNDDDKSNDDWWKESGSYHQILMKEIVHHLDAEDRLQIFEGMYEGLQSSPSKHPSILIITRPQIDIDYPLWTEAKHVWKENQPSIDEITKDLKDAGFIDISYTVESYPCSIQFHRWQSMIQQRFWSTFSKFTDEELMMACQQIADRL